MKDESVNVLEEGAPLVPSNLKTPEAFKSRHNVEGTLPDPDFNELDLINDISLQH